MTHARLRAATIVAAAGVVLGNAVAAPVAQGPPAGVRRIDLQRHDLGAHLRYACEPAREQHQRDDQRDPGRAASRRPYRQRHRVDLLLRE